MTINLAHNYKQKPNQPPNLQPNQHIFVYEIQHNKMASKRPKWKTSRSPKEAWAEKVVEAEGELKRKKNKANKAPHPPLPSKAPATKHPSTPAAKIPPSSSTTTTPPNTPAAKSHPTGSAPQPPEAKISKAPHPPLPSKSATAAKHPSTPATKIPPSSSTTTTPPNPPVAKSHPTGSAPQPPEAKISKAPHPLLPSKRAPSAKLAAPIEKPIPMPVGRGITPEIYSTYDLATKKAMSDLFNQDLAEEDSTRHDAAIAENVALDEAR